MKPNTFPTQNTHRVVLFQPDSIRPDFERLEDICADAIAAARTAFEAMERLPHPLFKRIERPLDALAEAVNRRRVLTEDYRAALADMLRALAEDEADLRLLLRDALNLSNRVADLLAAEKDIAWHRGFRE
ncbi:MAG: hypothetical protein LCH69_13590 [Proteobacteria bacterium]|nr:hypothetical protein [Pseudomonadota bacterium]